MSCLSGPLGNPTGPAASSAAPAAGSRGNSQAGSRENLCEECIQNPLDLIDASIQVSHSVAHSFRQTYEGEVVTESNEVPVGGRRGSYFTQN